MKRPAPDAATEQGPARPDAALGNVVGFVAAITMVPVLLQRAARPLGDTDVWFHLRAGADYLAGGSFISPEPLTPFATQDWYPRSWLPQLVFARVEEWLGLAGVSWLYGLGMVLLVAVIYVTARRQADPLAAGVVTLVATIGCMRSLTPRPHLLSFILLAVFTAAWLRAADNLRPPWWLVPVTWLWAMSHGMWVFGVALGVGVVIGMALDGQLTRRRDWRIALVPPASLVVAALTPQGPRLLWGISENAAFAPYVSEYLPPSLMYPHYVAVLLLIAVVLVSAARGREPLPWAHVAILVQAVVYSMLALRTLAWAAILVAPLAAAALQMWLPAKRDERLGYWELGGLTAVLTVGLVALALVIPRSTAAPSDRLPDGLHDELAALPEGTTVLNAYGLGSWLEWHHRNVAPVIDGLTYQFKVRDVEAHQDAVEARPGWEGYLHDRGATWALLQDDAPLSVALTEHLGWRIVDADDDFVLLTDRPTPG